MPLPFANEYLIVLWYFFFFFFFYLYSVGFGFRFGFVKGEVDGIGNGQWIGLIMVRGEEDQDSGRGTMIGL